MIFLLASHQSIFAPEKHSSVRTNHILYEWRKSKRTLRAEALAGINFRVSKKKKIDKNFRDFWNIFREKNFLK